MRSKGLEARGCSDSYLLSLSSLGGTFSSKFQYVLRVDAVSENNIRGYSDDESPVRVRQP